MAYIDDNNDLTAGKGKDPIKELDDELEQLLAQLNESEKTDKNTDNIPDQNEDASKKPDTSEDEAQFDVEHPAETTMEQYSPEPPKKRSKAPIIIIAAIVLIGLIGAGVWYFFGRTQTDEETDEKTPGKVLSTETFTDSELGEVTVQNVEGMSLNTYDEKNLSKNSNGFYEYTVDGKVISEVGVDLAEYQGEVDFAAVKNSGVDFVILRIGGRYYSAEGALYEDGNFDTYYSQATEAGLKVGAYFFSQAATEEEAVEEAEYVVKKLNGRKLTYPVAFDWENIEDDDARTDDVSGDTITAMAEKFCDTIEKEGYKSIVYANTSMMLQSYDFTTMKNYEFWLADYREFPNMYYDFAIWQYDKEGTVSGISGTVDLNICFKPY